MSSLVGSLIGAGAAKPTRRSRSTAGKRGSATPAGNDGSQRGKFNANGEKVNGVWMASEAQAERYRQLLRMEMSGRIANLRTEVAYPLVVNNSLICRYRADFTYDEIDDRGGVIRHVIEDVKGMVTPEFRLKQKLFDALMPIRLSIIEVKGKLVVYEEDGTTKKKDKAGATLRSTAAWMHHHWADRLPPLT